VILGFGNVGGKRSHIINSLFGAVQGCAAALNRTE
jgi:hypothetical protein